MHMVRVAAGRRWPAILIGSIAGLLAVCAIAAVLLNPMLTRYVESDAFRAELEKETAKGLHFPASHFGLIRRTGLLSAATDRFTAEKGEKAMTKFDVHGISARFNPLGVFLRRWQLDDLHLDGGEVGIQTYEPKPEPSPTKPWFHVFLPSRVYLKRIASEPANVTWRLRDKPAGFYDTRLLITPHGRDFEYRANGGTMKMALIPELQLRQVHMLITKERLSLYALDLGSGAGSVHGEGTAGTREDKSVNFQVKFAQLPLRDWLPESLHAQINGTASGEMQWRGPDAKLDMASMHGTLHVRDGRLRDLEFLRALAAITRRAEFASLSFNECTAELSWEKGVGELKKIALEENGKFRLEGDITVRKDALGGALQLGLAPEFLEWLPKADEVFTHGNGGYLWTTVHLSGTLEAPQQDLSPRLLAALKETPGAFIGAALRTFGEWLNGGGK